MFNLSVDGTPEYFANGVLVHNCIADGLLWDAMRQIPDVKMVQPPPPKESIGYRIAEYERAKKKSGRLAY